VRIAFRRLDELDKRDVVSAETGRRVGVIFRTLGGTKYRLLAFGTDYQEEFVLLRNARTAAREFFKDR
jgi:hypothetical protein